MAWQWSHTQEAYHNVKANVYGLPMITLIQIRAEQLAQGANGFHFDDPTYHKEHYRLLVSGITHDALAQSVYDEMADNIRLCNNGGFDAWCCPYGCHTVSFDVEA